MIKLGAPFPFRLIGSDPAPISYYLQAIEQLGFHFTSAGGHTLGADRSIRPDWKPYFGKAPLFDHNDPMGECFVMFGYLAALTKKLELTTLLLLPQFQTILVAKQAALADVLTGGRIRLVPALGWNEIEYEALNENFHNRGARIEEQVQILRLLWTQNPVTFKGKWHSIPGAGINPLPVQRPIPIWFGGASDRVLKRTGRIGDGWWPSYPFFNETQIRRDIELIRQTAKEHGRDPLKIGIQGMAMFHDHRFQPGPGDKLPPKTLEEGLAEAHLWKAMGATHFTVPTLGPGLENTLPAATNALRAANVPGFAKAVYGSSDVGVDKQLEALRKFKEGLGKDF